MNILAVDTSSKSATVCITKNNKIVAESFCNASLTHSQTFMSMVEGALSISKTNINEIDYFASTIGPGSFTGLRIGLGAVKAMAQALSKSCVGVSSLEALAYNFLGYEGIICPVMDARCGQVYTALFRAENGKISRLTEDSALKLEELRELLPRERIYLVGCGSEITFNALNSDETLDLIMPLDKDMFLKGSSVANLAREQIQSSQNIVPAEQLVPSYLRLPQAQRELLKKQK